MSPAAGESGRPTRGRILEAALDLAGREGVAALTTRRVAMEARVNLGLLHYYFESKEALVAETLGLFMAEMRLRFESMGAQAGRAGAEEALVAGFSAALEHAARRPGLVFGVVAQIVGEVSDAIGGWGEEGAPPPSPPGGLAALQDFLAPRVRELLAARLGGDEALVARRSIQLFTSIFHPLLFTPFPRIVFGCDLGTRAARMKYVRAVVADAVAPAP